MLLILDLDDTLYATKSIPRDIVAPAISLIEEGLLNDSCRKIDNKSAPKIKSIIQELWERPFDVVAKKHHFPQKLVDQFYTTINSIDFQLAISPFPDYPHLKAIKHPKILVTTGFEKLQFAKIESLGIGNDFQAIHIDDPSSKERKGKQQLFAEIIAQSNLPKDHIWVIGDNPNAEILAGSNLGLTTVQVIKNQQTPSDLSDYSIASFGELALLLRA